MPTGGTLANLLYTQEADGISIVGFQAEDGELMQCEGCGAVVMQTILTEDDVAVCEPCLKLCEEEING
jgi:hypothetical protein